MTNKGCLLLEPLVRVPESIPSAVGSSHSTGKHTQSLNLFAKTTGDPLDVRNPHLRWGWDAEKDGAPGLFSGIAGCQERCRRKTDLVGAR